MKEQYNDLAKIAGRLRAHALRMVHATDASHIGSCLSMADILSVLYFSVLNLYPDQPDAPDRDRFILSKGHAAAIVYAALAERGFFPIEELTNFCTDGSYLTGHINNKVPGVEVATGSLGHGLPLACGMALASAGKSYRVFVMLSDGELDEGSNWEAILFAAHHKLTKLVAIVDYNKIQSFGNTKDVLDLEPLVDKFVSFGWGTTVIDGHNLAEILGALQHVPVAQDKPTVIIANTIKGKGVSYMENRLQWHYSSPDKSQLEQALAELGVKA